MFWSFTRTELGAFADERHAASRALIDGVGASGPSGADRSAATGSKRERPSDDADVAPVSTSKKSRRDVTADEASAPGAEDDGTRATGHQGGLDLLPRGPYLTIAEESAILNWSALALLRICRLAPFDRAITSIALVFFHRFYLRARLAEYPPHEMM
jgi:hypothetical protein